MQEDEESFAIPLTIRNEWFEGLKAEEGIESESIAFERNVAFAAHHHTTKKCGTVGRRSRADISTLGVDDERNPLHTNLIAEVFKDRKTWQSILLKEGDIWLYGRDPSLDR